MFWWFIICRYSNPSFIHSLYYIISRAKRGKNPSSRDWNWSLFSIHFRAGISRITNPSYFVDGPFVILSRCPINKSCSVLLASSLKEKINFFCCIWRREFFQGENDDDLLNLFLQCSAKVSSLTKPAFNQIDYGDRSVLLGSCFSASQVKIFKSNTTLTAAAPLKFENLQ